MKQEQPKKQENLTPAERMDLYYKLKTIRNFFNGQEMRYGYPDVKLRFKARREMIIEQFGRGRE